MENHRTRIGVCTDPFLLRTAVQRVLAGDPRLECVLLPAGDDVLTLVDRADVLVISGRLEISGVVVATLDEDSSAIELSRNGEKRLVPYVGLSSLGDLLATIDSIFKLSRDEREPPGGAGSTPGGGGGPRDT
jgi:hypothetical protein